jgi:CRISPR-associated protein Csm1
MLTDALARWLLRRSGMPAINLIYSGGGRFFALLPYIDDGDASLAEAQRALDRLLLKHHDGALYLSTGWAHLSAQDFTSPDRFSSRWQAVTAATGAAKRSRYATLPDDELFMSVFEPRMHGEQEELALRRSERDEVGEDQDENRGAASALGQSFEQFSRRLAQADYLLVSVIPPTPGPPAGFDAVLGELGLQVEPVLADELGQQWRGGEPPSEVDYAVLQGMRSAPEARELTFLRRQWGCPVVGSLRFTVNVTPMLNDGHQPATFDRLQEAAAADGAIKRLGVLRMDVDDLGALFAEGFRDPQTKASRASLARVASLSFALGLYFEGWVGELCARVNHEVVTEIPSDERGHFDRVEAVYAVYSGGDDLFIVGRWDVLPALAHAIQTDLTRYTAGIASIHLSAGITLHSGKYPLYQAAEEAKEALDRAKGLEGKAAVCFLGYPLKWAQWSSR